MKKIDSAVIGVLSRLSFVGTANGTTVATIEDGQLDRKLYVKVNEVLESFGGKWNRKVKAHIFRENPYDKIDGVILSGEFTDSHAFDFFETPSGLAEKLVCYAGIHDLEPGSRILEPSAGRGAIADKIRDAMHPKCTLDLFEMREDNRKVLEEKGYKVGACDFMGVYLDQSRLEQIGYDAIVMNPPFSRQQDIDHVLHAYRMLREGGKLVAVMSAAVRFRENKRTVAFRERLEEVDGQIRDLPPGLFKSSGTMVNTVLVSMEK